MSFHEVGPMFILEGENPMKRREMIKLSLVLGGVVLQLDNSIKNTAHGAAY